MGPVAPIYLVVPGANLTPLYYNGQIHWPPSTYLTRCEEHTCVPHVLNWGEYLGTLQDACEEL